MARSTCLAALLLLVACGDDQDPMADAAAATADAPGADAAGADGPIDDAGPLVPLAGFGAISGSCDFLGEAEIATATPLLFRNTLDFGTDPYDDADLPLLSAGGQEVIADGNAGGSSLLSEAFSYEVLYRCELAALLKTETEVVYDVAGTITDLLVEVDGHKLGVSVTRAYVYPTTDPYTVAMASSLLERKLLDIQESSANVSAADAWDKQILHVIAYAPAYADSIEAAWAALDASVMADTIVVVTVTEGADEPIY